MTDKNIKIKQIAICNVDENIITQCEAYIVLLTEDGRTLIGNNRLVIAGHNPSNNKKWLDITPSENDIETNT